MAFEHEGMSFGSKEWNEFYHGRNNRVRRKSELAKRQHAAFDRALNTKRGEEEYYDALRASHDADALDAFLDDLASVNRPKKAGLNAEALGRVLDYCFGV